MSREYSSKPKVSEHPTMYRGWFAVDVYMLRYFSVVADEGAVENRIQRVFELTLMRTECDIIYVHWVMGRHKDRENVELKLIGHEVNWCRVVSRSRVLIQ